MRKRFYLIIVISIIANFVSVEYSYSKELYGHMIAPGLIEKDWSQLSDHFASRTRLIAINIKFDNSGWKHAESDYFIYHYVNKTQLIKAYNESTFYLRTAFTDLQLKEMPGEYDKFHIWIFPADTQWVQFCMKVRHNPRSSGFTTHQYREFYGNFAKLGRNASNILAHEIAHVVIGNLMNKKVPTWLNEGFASYEGDEAYARYKNVRVNSEYFDTHNETVIPFNELVSIAEYPQSRYGKNEKALFYNHAELLVRIFIDQYGLKKFAQFVTLLKEKEDVKDAMRDAFGIQDINAFAKRYEESAQKFLH